jgi:hypothetical protein
MRKCHFCHEDIEDAARVCVHCGRDLIPGHTSAPIETVPAADPAATIVVPAPVPPTVARSERAVPIARVSVVDVDMPFGSMVLFMVKWAIASIPAVLIVGFILGVIVVGLAIALGALGMLTRGFR